MLPFSREQFISVFADYNQAVWPAQIVAYALGAVAVAALIRRWNGADRLVGSVLAVMWVWTGVAYHGLYFSAINKPALLFGAMFVLQGALLAHAAVARGAVMFSSPAGVSAWLGWALVLYAAVVYPLVGWWAGHGYPAMPMFGITPCPVTLFTFGMLLLTTGPVPRRLLAVPFLWSLVGGSAAILLDVPQDWPLLLSGVIAAPVIARRR